MCLGRVSYVVGLLHYNPPYIGHRKLYINIKDQILHRDLGLQGFKCYKVKDRWKAVLIDHDLSTILSADEERQANNKHRTGTAPFMARELLKEAPPGVMIEHVYAHELESWLYPYLYPLKIYKGCAIESPIERIVEIFMERYCGQKECILQSA